MYIVYDIVYDIVYNIAYDIMLHMIRVVYDIRLGPGVICISYDSAARATSYTIICTASGSMISYTVDVVLVY